MLTIAAFVVTLSVLIAIHEYGHYQVARWCGVKVLRFSIGFGRPLWKRKLGRDNTEFVLAALPLGGYVKMLDEREDDIEAGEDLARAFNRQVVWKRIAIVLAGPAANLLLAILLYWVLFMHGVQGMRPILGEVAAGTPAAQASLKSGLLIQKVAGVPTPTWQDVRWVLLQKSLQPDAVEVEAADDASNLYLYRLSLKSVGKDDYEEDFLDKLGLKPYQPTMPATIGEMVRGGVAERAGMHADDEVKAVNGIAMGSWEQFVETIRQSPGVPLRLDVVRAGQPISLTLTPDSVAEGSGRIGRIGAMNQIDQAALERFLVNVRYGPWPAAGKAVDKTWETAVFSLKMLGNMLIGKVSWQGISGPVTIASYAGQSADLGWKAFLGFLALISISLGVLNLLPIPVLDGGHLMYYIAEVCKGSPVSEATMGAGQRVGLVILGLLMVVAFYNDINRFFTG